MSLSHENAAYLPPWHEPTLRRRLCEVLDFVGPGITPLTGQRGRFISRVVDMRNALTHWDEVPNAPRGADLHQLAAALNFVVDAALLRLLGFDQEQVRATLADNQQFQSR